MQSMLLINLPGSFSDHKQNGCLIWLEGCREVRFHLFGMQHLKVQIWSPNLTLTTPKFWCLYFPFAWLLSVLLFNFVCIFIRHSTLLKGGELFHNISYSKQTGGNGKRGGGSIRQNQEWGNLSWEILTCFQKERKTCVI